MREKDNSLIAVIGVMIFFVIIFSLIYIGFKWDKILPRFQKIKNNTETYNENKIKNLEKYKLQYEQTTDNLNRKAIKNLIIHTYSDYDSSNLPFSLKIWFEKIIK